MTKLLNRLRAPYAAQGYAGLMLEAKLFQRLTQLSVAWLQARWSMRSAYALGTKVFAYGRPVIKLEREAHLELGEEVRLESGVHRTRLSVRHKARLIIGNDVRLNGCIISANSEVIVKDRARIGPWAHVMDGDFHSVEDRSAAGKLRPVIIEEGAWLTTRCMVLKGVTIGRGAVVAAGSVVTKDVDPYTVVAGVPAKVVKRLPKYATYQAELVSREETSITYDLDTFVKTEPTKESKVSAKAGSSVDWEEGSAIRNQVVVQR